MRIWKEPEIDQISACGESWSVVKRRNGVAAGAERVERIDTRVRQDAESGEGMLAARGEGNDGGCPSCVGVRRVPGPATRLWE